MEKKEESGEKQTNRYVKQETPAPSSRYNDAETLRTGSRYADKARTAAVKTAGLVRIAGPAALILGLIGYLVAAFYFSDHFYPGTTIYGINCSIKTADWARAEIDRKVGSYTLTMEERGGRKETLTASDIQMHYDDNGALESRMKRQFSAIWPVMMLIRRGTPTPVEAVYEEALIGPAVSGLACFAPENVTAPEDAYIEETADGYIIRAEVMGTTLDHDAVVEKASQAIAKGKEVINLELKECYQDPAVYRDDPKLNRIVQAKNALLGANITYDFDDRSQVVDTPVIMTFIREDGSGGYLIDPDAVASYVNEMADRFDTMGGTRTFYTTVGTVETLYGGDYGWAMDREATARELMEAIREKRREVVEPVYMYRGMCRASDDIGDTYVEICIAKQEMWCYKDGELLVDTPVVTGNVSKGYDTPSGGVWAIDAKVQDYVLVGEGYNAPVDYWMPFNGNIGIHDMQSRYYFGSTIYLTHGSHGCVNTPLDAVRDIYEAVEIGTPVIVY